MIKFGSDLRQVDGFPGTPVSSTNKTDLHDILLKVALNTIILIIIPRLLYSLNRLIYFSILAKNVSCLVVIIKEKIVSFMI